MARKQIINPYLRFAGQKAQGPYANRVAGGTYARAVNRGARPKFIGFDADSSGEIKALVLGDGPVTFSRNSEPTFQDWEGITRDSVEDEIRFQLARRVRTHFLESLFNASNWRSVNGSTVSDGAETGQLDMAFSVPNAPGRIENNQLIYGGAGNLVGEDFLVSFEAKTTVAESGRGFQCQLGRYTGGSGAVHLTTFAATDQWQRFVLDGYPNFTDPANEGLRVSYWGYDAGSGDVVNLSVKNIQIERVTGQADQSPTPIPGEYTSPAVEYGVNVKGVRVFNFENASTVLNDVVTYAKGPVLTTNWGALFDPAATENGNGIFNFSNFEINKGSFVLDITMAAASNQGIINFADVNAGVCYFDTINNFLTYDGTNQASVDPSLATNLGDRIRFAILYDSIGGLSIGYKNITDSGPWAWDTDNASFDGGFGSSSVFNVFFNLATASTMRGLCFYDQRLTKDAVQERHP